MPSALAISRCARRSVYRTGLLLAAVVLAAGRDVKDSSPLGDPNRQGIILDPGNTEGCRKPLFPVDSSWNTDVSAAPMDAQSSAVISYLQGRGWGLGRIQIDFSMEVLCTDNAPMRLWSVKTDEFFLPDCDYTPIPIPAGGTVEGERDYACTGNGDCHLIVIQ